MRTVWTAPTVRSKVIASMCVNLLLDPFATAITQLPAWDFSPARGDDPCVTGGDIVQSTLDDAAAMPKYVFTCKHF